MKRGGYSLIELLIVIAILGVLAGIGSYSWASASARSRDSIRKADVSRIKNALAQYYLDTKQYPNFDVSNGRIYAAKWQLSTGTSCAHDTTIAKRLSPNYIGELPEDPRQKKDFTKESCGTSLTTGQNTRYLYISAPSDANTPTNPANGFGLMVSLERAGSDILAEADNPLKTGTTFFGSYYSGTENYGTSTNIGVNANYLITGRFGR